MSKYSIFRKYNEDGAVSTLYGVFNLGDGHLNADTIKQAISDNINGETCFTIKDTDNENLVLSCELAVGPADSDPEVYYVARKTGCPLSEIARSCITRHRNVHPEISLEWFLNSFESSLMAINPMEDRWWAYMHDFQDVKASIFFYKGEYKLRFRGYSGLEMTEITGRISEPYELEY